MGMQRQVIGAAAVALVSAMLAVLPATVATASPAATSERLCRVAKPGFRACLALRRLTPAAPNGILNPLAVQSGYGPSDLKSAYNLPATGGVGVTVAIVDAMDQPNAESDLGVYRSNFGLPPCTTANGCFHKINQSGAAAPLPTPDSGWAGEIDLDIDMVSAICPSCNILLVEATSASDANLDAAVNTAVSLGAKVVSNSYGGAESSSQVSENSFYNHPGVLITASSGDQGYEVEYPAAAPSVLAVGGTALTKATNARGWTETVWSTSATEGAGSGCSRFQAKPSFQKDTGCTKRTVADVSAVSDPATGASVYNTFPGVAGGWQVYGGTSVASPLVASVFALTGHASATSQYPYANPTFFNDVVSGKTATCGTYLCTAGSGYDGPTGIGTPNGTAIAGGTAPSQDFSLSVSPASASVAAGGAAGTTVNTATVLGSEETVSLSASDLPSGAKRFARAHLGDFGRFVGLDHCDDVGNTGGHLHRGGDGQRHVGEPHRDI